MLIPTMLLLAGSAPCACAKRAACTACTPLSAALVPCNAARRLSSVDFACCEVSTAVFSALPTVPDSASVRPDFFCSTL
ncbi:hypothetical protein D3C72_1848380 [compost metagenome]